ncbi:MAG: TRAP transporter small permease [Desulfosudaceae bacterium]
MSRRVRQIGAGLARAHDRLIRLEKGALCLLLFSMILLSFSQVIMRNLFSCGFSWANEVLRTEVIWIAFIGAALATEHNRHIRIDIVSRVLWHPPAQRIIAILNGVFTAAVSILLFAAAVKYVSLMQPYSTASVFFGLPEWLLRLIIPYSFAAMTIRCGKIVVRAWQAPSAPPETS